MFGTKFLQSFVSLKKNRTFAPHYYQIYCPDGGIGRRAGLKNQ